jgi:AmiR/NasT family two-component response regulator
MKTDHKPAKKTQSSAAKRMVAYRERMRAQGLRPVQIWMQDTKSPEFIAKLKREAEILAVSDPAGDEIMAEIEAGYEWPEYNWPLDR